MEQDKEKIKRKAQKVVDNLGNVNLATLETSLEIVDKLEDVVETLKGHHQEMMEKPEKEIPEVSLEETNTLLKELLDESKKKEEYAYDIEIDPALKEQLKGENGKDGVDGKNGLNGIDGIDGRDGIDGKDGKDGSPDTPNQIADKLNTIEEVIDQKVIRGLTKKISDLSSNIAHNAVKDGAKLYTGVSETRVREIVSQSTSGGTWGSITGTLSDQTDLQSALDAKLSISTAASTYVPYTGATTDVDLGTHTLTSGPIDITGVTTTATLGSEMITNAADRNFSSDTGNWTGTNWTIGGGVATAAASAGNFTLALAALNSAPVIGALYLYSYTVTWSSTANAKNLDTRFGGGTNDFSNSMTANTIGTTTVTGIIIATNTTSPFTIVPYSFVGTIDNVSLKRVTPTTPTQTFRNSNNSIGTEIRSGGASLDTTFMGINAGRVNTRYDNTAFGSNALASNVTGDDNMAFGLYSLSRMVSGSRNVGFGTNTLRNNVSGSDNVAIGDSSMRSGASGFSKNIGIGIDSFKALAIGNNNIGIGYRAGFAFLSPQTSTYSNNILIGHRAADNITDGANNNIVIGYDIDLPTASGSNQMTIGNLLYSTGIDGTGTTVSTGSIGIGVASQSGRLHVRGGGATKATTALYVDNSTPTQIFRLNNDGSLNIGTSNTLTGTQAIVMGYSCQATGDNTVSIGYASRASGTGAISISPNSGAGYSEASGAWSVIVGGELQKAEGRYSTLVGGRYGRTTLYNQITFGHDRLVGETGSFQTSIVPLASSITGTAQTELFIPSLASGQAIIPVLSENPNYTMWNATITVNALIASVGNGTGTLNHVFGGEYRCIVRRAYGSTTVTMVGSGVQTIYEDADTTMADAVVTIDGDSTTGALRVRFTPPTTAGSTTNIRVGCTIQYLQILRA